ncbi:hypothetical protein TrVFT333_003888 [Trichoderma virens FT-333]|nr:hypothetical protein TrVFT333_003888 [Trichoderma virens FT-333]
MRAAAVIAIFAATAMAQTGGHASPTNGTSVTHTGKPTTTPTSGANSLSQNILLGVEIPSLDPLFPEPACPGPQH